MKSWTSNQYPYCQYDKRTNAEQVFYSYHRSVPASPRIAPPPPAASPPHLHDVVHIGDQRERVEPAARDERLDEDVHLAVHVLRSAQHGLLAVLVDVAVQLVQLVVTHLSRVTT